MLRLSDVIFSDMRYGPPYELIRNPDLYLIPEDDKLFQLTPQSIQQRSKVEHYVLDKRNGILGKHVNILERQTQPHHKLDVHL